MRRAALALAFLGACGEDTPSLPPACEAPVAGSAITFRFLTQTQGAALLVTSPPHDLRRFVVERDGRIKLLTDTGLAPAAFLDVTAKITAGGEQGLLGLAFHPKFASNGTFFVFYTLDDANVVERFTVSAMNPDVADPASGVVVLSIPDFAGNHNGGMIEFGPDGFLYIGTGDGGGGGDPQRTGQDPNRLLGKLLRIDVDKKAADKEYGIPAGNPFASGGGAPEVYVMGLRNPWRWSFDKNGDLYIGDVGQNMIEELTMLPAGEIAGKNLGWNMYEGESCFAPPCDPAGKVMPQFAINQSSGWCSVIGGQTYRGGCYPDIVGKHYFTDYCSHELRAATRMGAGLTVETIATVDFIDAQGQTRTGMPVTPTSLHADARGELYLTTEQPGAIYKLEAHP